LENMPRNFLNITKG